MLLIVDKMEVFVTKKRTNKNMYLRVKKPDGKIVITAPTFVTDAVIKRFVLSKKGWIKEEQSRIINLSKEQQESPSMERQRRAFLQEDIENLLQKYEPIMNVKANGFTIRKMTTRWGSCNIKTHHLNFSYELSKVPYRYREYVVVHELSHILEPSHNEHFWNIMETYLPGAKQLRKELNQHEYNAKRPGDAS
ncbi:MAG: SprT family zinc-dependent metalloprotease [Agathobacter sp.]|nr:SprT family zinc-dependent metalloprotease [Agathobacter sp.]